MRPSGPNRWLGLATTMVMAAIAAVAALGPTSSAWAEAKDVKEPTPEQVEFFEKKIRPVLVEKCYSCHSHDAKKVKGDYYLDTRDAMIKGGESGKPAIVPGEPDKSPLIQMIKRVDEDAAMPPKEKDALSKEQVKDFEEWVKQGVPDPRKESDKGGKTSAAATKAEAAKNHWAFKKPAEPAVPQVKNAGWVRSPVDAFVLARLEAKGMTPAPQADKRTLIRRAHFTLTGLPPTPEEVAAFEADASPDAFAKVVDRLLASPQYGERWGRFWLDVARYADTKGYVFQEERTYPFAYTYRDYVIRAFNEDLPYDQFLIQQIAADRLNLGGDKRPLAAMGFLTVGRRFLNSQPDIIDDRIDVVTRGTMALTVQCARCHDHKYDPIPIADYYSLYGVFASSIEPAELPTLGTSEQTAASRAFDTELKARQAAADAYLNEQANKLLAELRSPKSLADQLMVAQFKDTPAEAAYTAGIDVKRRVNGKWKALLAKSKEDGNPVFVAWHAYAAIAPDKFAAEAAGVTAKLFAAAAAPADASAKPINPLIIAAFKDKPVPASMREVADRYGTAINAVDRLEAYPEPEKEALRELIQGEKSPLHLVNEQWLALFGIDQKNHYRELKSRIEQLKATDPGAPPMAMVMNDSPTPANTPIFKRGNAGMPGEVVPRQFLACATTGERKPFTDGSGRLELAKAIASPDNPLTARVMVNRIWLNQFGSALVRTPSDFGVRSDPPTHPELLDWLALRFVDGGWSIKKLQRSIMLSATWQQASDHPSGDAYATSDPENTLLWHQNRRRMDLETLRDSLLAVAGQLDATFGGRPVDITDAANNRRTVYGFIDRQNLPGMFRTFDFASPDQHSPVRFFTTVPQQALFMLNSPLVERASRQVVARKDVATQADAGHRVDRIYRTLFGRPASAEEIADGAAFVGAEDAQPVVNASPWQYGYGRYDAAANRVADFTPFTHHIDGKWQAAPQRIESDGRLKYCELSANGGHPGTHATASVVRRWVAPADGSLAIAGSASHKQDKGDGVVARIVSSRQGQIASWTIQRIDVSATLTGIPVTRGEAIDFVIEPRANSDYDSTAWAPTLKLTGPNVAVAGGEGVRDFDAQRDFSGASPTAMSAWEKYAQTLLLSNEFAFVD